MSNPSRSQKSTTSHTAIIYSLMLAAAVGIFLLIRRWGEMLIAPAPAASLQPNATSQSFSSAALLHVLVALAAVIIAGRVLGKICVRLRQPPVIGEIMAGILLGPSLLGWLAPKAAVYILPQSLAPVLGVISQLGVVLYMFMVGLELNTGRLREHAQAIVTISHASIVVPFLLGTLLALGLYPRVASRDVPFTHFALFLGVSMSITAFPVLARILTDKGISGTELGIVALSCAAINDVTAWCLLVFVSGVAQSQLGGALRVVLLTVCYIVCMFLVARPLFSRFITRYDTDGRRQDGVALVLVAMLLSALITELIGIHAIFGAFLLGAIIPRDSALARDLTRQLKDVVVVLLLPAFFAYT